MAPKFLEVMFSRLEGNQNVYIRVYIELNQQDKERWEQPVSDELKVRAIINQSDAMEFLPGGPNEDWKYGYTPMNELEGLIPKDLLPKERDGRRLWVIVGG